MALHFTRAEFDARIAATVARMEQRGLDGMLLFSQESMFWLTGYDTFGFCFFQCLYLGADSRLMLVTRAPDRLQAAHTSIIEDIRIWVDREGATPADDLREALAKVGCAGKTLGIEYDTWGLTAGNGRRVDAALDGFCTTEDASGLVSALRVVKSDAEIAYVRRAAELADDALDEAHRLTGPDVDEGEILAAMQGAVFRGGGDYPGNEFIIGSGPDALLCRYFTGRRKLSDVDQMTLEFAGAYRHYHACLMRTIPVGKADPRHEDMHKVAVEALWAAQAALRPGEPIGKAFDAHAHAMDAGGYQHARLNACGYSLGATFAPVWMDHPMLYSGNSFVVQPGMVIFLHMILADDTTGLAMAPGETVLVTTDGAERLSRSSVELVVK